MFDFDDLDDEEAVAAAAENPPVGVDPTGGGDWTSISPVAGERPRCLRPSCEVSGIVLTGGALGPFRAQSDPAEFKLNVAKRLPGDAYGLPIPATATELKEMGPAWLTRAFHATGSLPKSNRVTRITSMRDFVGGGSGPKCFFVVEYEKPSDDLDTELFAKFPWPLELNEAQRLREQCYGFYGDTFGGEIQAYLHVCPKLPFAVPRFYFGDVNRSTTNACCINAAVKWPVQNSGLAESAGHVGPAYEVCLPAQKCCDDLLPCSPHLFYLALVRKLGIIAAYDKSGKLDGAGPVQWTPWAKPDIHPGAVKGGPQAVTKFVQEVAPHWFTTELRTPVFARKLEEQMAEVTRYSKEIIEYVFADERYQAIQHLNANTDNAFFYWLPDGSVDCGLLDWGQTTSVPLALALGYCLTSCQAEMLVEHEDALLHAFVEAYDANRGGGSRQALAIDFVELRLQFRLFWTISTLQALPGARGYLKLKEKVFDRAPSIRDATIRQDFHFHFGLSMLYNKVLFWNYKGDEYFADFRSWVGRRKVSDRPAGT